MKFKDIVVYLDASESESYLPRLSYAASLATRFGAHVAVAYVPEDMALNPHAGFVRGAAIGAALESHRKRAIESHGILVEVLDQQKRSTDLSFELRICKDEFGEQLMLHARHSSLAILGPGRQPERQVSALTLAEDVIFASGCPSILLPHGWDVTRSIGATVIGWNGSRQAARAIADAMPLLVAAQSVHVVVVPEPKILRLLGEDPGTDIARHLSRNGVNVEVHCLHASNSGNLLLAKAHELGADLIVAGAYGQPKITEFIFGSATQELLANPKIPLLLSC